MNRRYVVSKAPGVAGAPIPDNEPCLVIRAQDILAVHMLQHYISLAVDFGVSAQVIDELYSHLSDLQDWRYDNPDKIKLADR